MSEEQVVSLFKKVIEVNGLDTTEKEGQPRVSFEFIGVMVSIKIYVSFKDGQGGLRPGRVFNPLTNKHNGRAYDDMIAYLDSLIPEN